MSSESSGKPIRVLGISASPRDTAARTKLNHGKESHSSRLMAKLLAYVTKYGGETETVRLAEQKIAPCLGCYSDSKDGTGCTYPCRQVERGDTANRILEKIVAANALVISTPIYWGGVPGPLANLIQRMTALENNRYDIRDKNKGQEPILAKPIVCLASQKLEGASIALAQLAWGLNHMGFTILPWSLLFEHNIMENGLVRFGLRVIGEQGFDWMENTLRLVARNILLYVEHGRRHTFDDYEVKEGVT
jgi:NAD(P)H-dependent FMN reductase